MEQLNLNFTGTVVKILDKLELTGRKQMAQIRVEGADFLYDELRISVPEHVKMGSKIKICIEAA